MPSARTIRRLTFALAAATFLLVSAARTVDAQFDTPSRQFHNATAFRLDGKHRDIECDACHVGGMYKGTPTQCVDCHWVRRQDDRYRLQLGAQCEQCHRPVSWTATRWDHGAMTGMPLGAAHRQLTCQSCHSNDGFRMAQTGCVSCHQDDYQRTAAPNHLAAGFPTTCEACHLPSGATWAGASLNHSALFPLAGRHATTACARCHLNGVYTGTPRTCVGCHQAQYNQTTNPSHLAAAFPTTCESCHRFSDQSWTQGTFTHRFVITSGPHRVACSSCHTATGSYGVFNCLSCHDRARMDDKHRNRTGYRYDSLTCYGCHPRGRE